MKKASALILSVFLLGTICVVLNSYEIDQLQRKHKHLKSLIVTGDYLNALIVLEEIRDAGGDLYKINNYPFLEGWLCAKAGDKQKAREIYSTILKDNQLLKDYILFELAKLNKKTNPEKSIKYLKQIIDNHKQSLLVPDALKLIADVYASMGNDSKARNYYYKWGRYSWRYRKKADFHSAVLYEKEGQNAKAASIYQSLLRSNRRSDIALQSVERLGELEKRTGKKYYNYLSHLYQRAITAFVNRSYNLSARYFYRIYKSKSPKNPYRARSLYYLSRTYERSGQYDKAVIYYGKLIRSYPGGRWERRGLYQLSRVYLLKGERDKGINTLTLLIKKHPRSNYALTAYFLLFQNALASDKIDTALKYSKEIRKRFYRRNIGMKVTLETAIIYYQQGKRGEALKLINELLRRKCSSSFRAELMFWKGKIYESMGKLDLAREQFVSIISKYPNDFYRYLAQDRLKIFYIGQKKEFCQTLYDNALKDINNGRLNDAKLNLTLVMNISRYPDLCRKAEEKLKFIHRRKNRRKEVLSLQPLKDRPILRSPPDARTNLHLRKATEFAFLGLYEMAAEEFKKYRARDYRDMKKLLTLATYYSKAGNPNRALYWAESLIKLIGKDIDYLLLPEGVKKLLYPRDFESIVDQFAHKRGIDKYFVLALIREESKFKPDAKSPAAARGLMQFIPSTARDVAAELGLEDFELDSLYWPELNINLGTQYLSNLMKVYRNNPIYVLSAYNSGEKNTKRWKERCESEEPEEFIARIDYPETRNYVKRVMASFRTYRVLSQPQE